MNSSGWTWWIERGKLSVGTTSDNGTTVTPPSSAGKTIRIYAKEVGQVATTGGPDQPNFSTGTDIDLDEYSRLPEEFHEALIAKVMEKLYRKDVEGIKIAEYWRTIYSKYMAEGKKYANKGRLDSGFSVMQHDM